MRPLSATLTPGLPAHGDRGEFIGRDAHGNTFLLRWHGRDGWLALGWEGAGDAGWPVLHQLTGEQQGLIKGHIEIAGSGAGESPAGPEGAAVKNGTRPEDRHPAGVRALGTSAISQAALAQAAARIAREASSWAADTLDLIGTSEEPAPAATVRRFISRLHDRLQYLDRRAFGSEAEL